MFRRKAAQVGAVCGTGRRRSVRPFSQATSPLLASYLMDQQLMVDSNHTRNKESRYHVASGMLERAIEDAQSMGADSGNDDHGTNGTSADSSYHNNKKKQSLTGAALVTDEQLEEALTSLVSTKATDKVSSLLNHLRVDRGRELEPRHYNGLLRLFTASKANEIEKIDQLLEVMIDRNVVDVETIGCCINLLHTTNHNRLDTLKSILTTCEEFSDHLAYPVRAHVKSRERESIRPLPKWIQDLPEEERPQESLILSALMHHVGNCCTANAAILVAIWIRAVGCELSGWDYAHLLTALVREAGAFDHGGTKALFGCFSECEPGSVSLKELKDRINGMVAVANDDTLMQIFTAMESTLEQRGRRRSYAENGPAVSEKDEGRSQVDKVVGEGVEEEASTPQQTDYSNPGAAEEDTVVHIGWVNRRAMSLDVFIDHIFEEVHKKPLLGPRGENIGELHHFFFTLLSTCRLQGVAIQWVPKMLQAQAKWKEQFAEQWSSLPKDMLELDTTDPARTRLFYAGSFQIEVPHQGFNITLRMVRDVGLALPTVSHAVRQELNVDYAALVDGARDRTPDAAFIEIAADGFALIVSEEDAVKAWNQVLVLLDRSRNSGHSTPQKSSRAAVRAYLQVCALHPPENPKYSSKDLKDRKKWAQYSDARDIALQVSKDTPEGRDLMKELYYNDLTLKPRKDPESVKADVKDFCAALDVEYPEDGDTDNWFKNNKNYDDGTSGTSGSNLGGNLIPDVSGFHYTKTDTVPRHLWDPDVYNPYPHKNLLLPAKSIPGDAAGGGQQDGDGVVPANSFKEDPFNRAWLELKNTDRHAWIYEDHEFCNVFLKCLIYRCRWTEASEFTLKYVEKQRFSFFMDAELSRSFEDMGDSSGAMHFKLLTNIFDGRIGQERTSNRKQMVATNPLKR